MKRGEIEVPQQSMWSIRETKSTPELNEQGEMISEKRVLRANIGDDIDVMVEQEPFKGSVDPNSPDFDVFALGMAKLENQYIDGGTGYHDTMELVERVNNNINNII